MFIGKCIFLKLNDKSVAIILILGTKMVYQTADPVKTITIITLFWRNLIFSSSVNSSYII